MKILIADSMHPSIFDMLEKENWTYDYRPEIKRNDIETSLQDYDGLVIRSKTFLDRALLEKACNLKFIARAGAGLDLIDLDAAESLGIEVFHAGEGNRDAVGEHALGMLLALFNNILRADREVRAGTWEREGNRGVELMGKTVGIIGYGNNGQATAKRMIGFGCRVLAYDKFRDHYADAYAEEATLEDIMRQADVISVHVPLTEDTRFLINAKFVENVEKNFYLINCSRGETADIEAIAHGLRSGKILGACLDVLENEKLKTLTDRQKAAFDDLRGSDRTVLTPHIAGWTHESYHRINEVLVRQVKQWLEATSAVSGEI